MRNDDFEGFESTEEIVVVTHEAETVEKRFNDIALLGELDDVLTLQWQHNHQLSNDIGQLRHSRLVKTKEVVENVDIDEDRVSRVLALHRQSVLAANSVKLDEKGRSRLSIGVEEDIFKERTH